jgi:signal transduction histidine kinase/CheY-like chemotaxis protein
MDETDAVTTLHRVMLLNFISITFLVFTIPLGVVAYLQGNLPLGLMDHTVALIVLLNTLYLRRSANHRLACLIGVTITMVLYGYLLVTGGVNNTAHLWYYTFPLGSSFLLGAKRGAAATLILLLFALTFFALDLDAPHLARYSLDFIIRFIPSFIVVIIFSFGFEFFRETAETKLLAKNDELNARVGELKEMDRQLREAQQVLEHRVAERTAALSRMNADLQEEIKTRERSEHERRTLETKLAQVQKMEAIGTLAGSVAHDLNNVLSGLVSYPELLLLEIDADSPLRGPLRTIQKSGQKASEVVQDLLTLARRGVATSDALNLNDIVVEYLHSPEHHQLMADHPKVNLRVDLADHLWNQQGSAIHLRKTLMNLVSNAAEAQPKGGEIHIITVNCGHDLEVDSGKAPIEGDVICLTVVDKGVGIAPEEIEQIFEPFYTTKAMGRSGSGLGMAVVWGTVEDHRGQIQVDAIPGGGTRFKLFLPADRHLTLVNKEDLPLEQFLGQQERILVVDDVAEQREIAARILTRLNYDVFTVDSGEKALGFLRTETVDLVVLDMIMEPGMDGLDTYRCILDLRPYQKVVIASGYSESERVKDAQALGAGTYVRKPYSIENIGLAVRQCLDTC